MARYADAIAWIVDNDDTEWLDEQNPLDTMSVTAHLVCDMFGKDETVVLNDLIKLRDKRDRER